MERYICIHGHFYQPPRENAWLEFVEQQDSAYPFHDWNERITAECYAPNGMSRILDDRGNIERITNNYSRISFNFGPTLLAWMADREPSVYRTILEADKDSRIRFSGHGSAMAQAYNHTILPLSNSRDKRTQILWGIRDFEFRFGRSPEGMWLPETAVDLETLEILAEYGIQFTVLSPYQALRTRKLKSRAWRDADNGSVDPSTPYEVKLPSRRRIAVFFYDGPISQAIAFEGLLERGEYLAHRLYSAFSDARGWPQIVHIATDGETYGHHHKMGDMALAYALHHMEKNGGPARLTNYAEFLEKHPPAMEAEIRERSAWSCAHGVERWNSNCGCNNGGHPHWNQEWRRPLRQALDWLRDAVAPRFERKGGELLRDCWEARNDYIHVILARTPERREEFFAKHALRTLQQDEKTTVLKLMEMQRHAMLMYTSCGWFFDELSRIETIQVIHYAGRTLQLYEEVFGESLEQEFLQRLEAAVSNVAEYRNGRVIYEKFVRPSIVDPRQTAAHYALSSLFNPYPQKERVYCYSVEQEDFVLNEAGRARLAVGRARFTSEITLETNVFSFGALYMGGHSTNAGVKVYRGEASYNTLKKDLAKPFNRADFPEIIRLLDRHFGEATYGLNSIFHDDQRAILDTILRSAMAETEAVYTQIYETHLPMMRFIAGLSAPIPRFFYLAGEFALNAALRSAFENLEAFDPARIETILDESRIMEVPLDTATLAFTLRKTIQRFFLQLLENPEDVQLIQRTEYACRLARDLPFEVNVWKAQNHYYEMLQQVFPHFAEKASNGDPAARKWLRHFLVLGKNLSVSVQDPG